MRRGDDRESTLAAVLDRTHWDYSPAQDRWFLLAPLSRIFEGVAWEFKPRHDETPVVPGEAKPTGETDE